MVRLFDVNLLLALAWPTHVHHDAGHSWLAAIRGQGWATCPMTQAGFVRISALAGVTKRLVTIADATAILAMSTRAPEHVFWGQTIPLTEMAPELRPRIMGPQQLTDALLLDLAIRHGGVLATLDRRISNLLPPGSPSRKHLEVIPVD
jgi:toxin-antitoxin system PIN domain toxin